jgi:heptosyltransferase-3
VVHPGTRWQRKRWPIDRWIELTQRLLHEVSRVIISTGPAPDEILDSHRIRQAVGERALETDGLLSWAQLAGLLYRARLFVGVDTAAMHLAAACQCPTVAIFGPSIESAWHPWKVAYRVVLDRGAVLPKDDPDYFSKKEKMNLDHVTCAEVWNACVEMLDQKKFSAPPRTAVPEL